MQQPQQQAPQKPEQEPEKNETTVEKIKNLLPSVMTSIAGLSLIGVGIALTATGNVGVGLPILSTIAGIWLPSPAFNSTKKD